MRPRSSEGRGHRFESYRVRQIFPLKSTFPALAQIWRVSEHVVNCREHVGVCGGKVGEATLTLPCASISSWWGLSIGTILGALTMMARIEVVF